MKIQFGSPSKRLKGGGSCLLVPMTVLVTVIGGFPQLGAGARPADGKTTMSEVRARSQAVDRLIEKDYAEHKVVPNPLSSDEVFLRRIYLDVVGRIPSFEEAKAFLDSRRSDKRARLIDTLLGSEGYVSHAFNYWADLLRIKSRVRNVFGQPYIDWVKDALRKNMPYDVFVRELITAQGYIWEDGAAGYYLRDAGMPLDHMSNTFRVFLGTQLVCAQCHDHPYDAWTQRQYYQQAAYAYGVKTSDRSVYRKFRGKFRALNPRRLDSEISPKVRLAVRRLIGPLRYRVHETQAPLRLPGDYQYEDAKPKSVVKPKPIFGGAIQPQEGESPVHAYAKWLTSPENPRFTVVIANRLWKTVMGMGLIEPVDGLSDGYEASNPELMDYLIGLVQELDFDLRQYLRVLLNTRTYQRMASPEEVDPHKPYYFPGPVLRRMTAEQVWDSFLTLILPDIDHRKGLHPQSRRYAHMQALVDMEPREIIQLAKKRSEDDEKLRALRKRLRALQKDIRKNGGVGDPSLERKLRREVAQARRQALGGGKAMAGKAGGRRLGAGAERDWRWRAYPRQLVRASEVMSPAPPGHFLRQFGQSDRESIENAHAGASVPQVLTLLNGRLYAVITRKNSVLRQRLSEAGTGAGKIKVAFVSLLSRYPSDEELGWLLPGVQQRGMPAIEDLVWALINTRQFMFIQ